MNINSFNGIVIDDEQRFDKAVSSGDVHINGTAEFIEQVEAASVEIAGYGMFRNFTTCDRLTVSGSGEFRKKLLTETVRNTGECTVYGKLITDVLVNSGNMQLCAPSSLGRAVIKSGGELRAVSKVKVDRMTVNGTISVVGGVKAEKIEFISSGNSSADYIYAEEISVRREETSGNAVIPGYSDAGYVLSATEVDVIDADIEYSYIDQLCCDNAVIGPGCHIRELTYRGSITVDSSSFAERLIKV